MGTPMASITGETSMSSVWQAAPAEAATSSPISDSNVLASTPRKLTFRVLESLSSG